MSERIVTANMVILVSLMLLAPISLGSSSPPSSCEQIPAAPYAGSYTVVASSSSSNNNNNSNSIVRFRCAAGFHLIGEAEMPCSETFTGILQHESTIYYCILSQIV